MKKLLGSMFVVALLVTSSTSYAQEAETATPVAEAQESVSDTVAEEQTEILPVAETTPIAGGTVIAGEAIIDNGVVASGLIGTGQAFDQGCCNTCGGQDFAIQPVGFNAPLPAQPFIQENFAPATEAVFSQPITTGCSSCNAAVPATFTSAPLATPTPIVAPTFTPAPIFTAAPAAPVATFAAPAPVATFATAAPSPSFVAAAPTQTFVSAPAPTAACSTCGVQAAAPACNNCPPSDRSRSQRGLFRRLRNAGIGSIIRDDN